MCIHTRILYGSGRLTVSIIRVAQKHWSYIESISIGLISAQRFEMTLDRYWRRHAGLPIANGW